MSLRQAARLIGAAARMIRDGEQIGFIARAGGTAGSLRACSRVLRLVRHGRGPGFTIERILILFQLWRARSVADAGSSAHCDANELERGIIDLLMVVSALEDLAAAFKYAARGDGPNRNGIAEGTAALATLGRTRMFAHNALWFAAKKPAPARWHMPAGLR